MPKKLKLQPSISLWCHWRKKFKHGPTWIDYDRGISRLQQGFQLILYGEIYTFNTQSWSVGNYNILISDFKVALLNANYKDSLETALSETTQTPWLCDTPKALRLYFDLPSLNYSLLDYLYSCLRYR